jgi:hypothetical protein
MKDKLSIMIIMIASIINLIMTRSIVWLLPFPWLIVFILNIVYENKKYDYKIVFPVILTFILSEALLLIYIYQVKSVSLNFLSFTSIISLIVFLFSLTGVILISIIIFYYIITGKYRLFSTLNDL